MKQFFTFLKTVVRHPVTASRFGRASLLFLRDYLAFARQAARQKVPLAITSVRPMLGDRAFDHSYLLGHYFHQDLYVASRVFESQPKKHVDIGSRIDGFVAHVAAFREIEVLDVRDPGIRVPNIIFRQADLMSPEFNLVEYCDSASSLHVIEHFGLGRYGDRLDPNGHEKGLNAIHRMLKPGGVFYMSVPIGPSRVEFNAHRVFSLRYLTEILERNFSLIAFSYENDEGRFFENVKMSDECIASNGGCHLGCGIFELMKK